MSSDARRTRALCLVDFVDQRPATRDQTRRQFQVPQRERTNDAVGYLSSRESVKLLGRRAAALVPMTLGVFASVMLSPILAV
jgi:hypothetical protein